MGDAARRALLCSALLVLLAQATSSCCRARGAPEKRDPSTGASEELTVTPLLDDGVHGGRIEFPLPGNPAQVHAMLLDFDSANGWRAWAKDHRTLRRGPSVVEALWTFEGRMGLNPSARLTFRSERLEGEIVIDFHLTRPVFGLARFSGQCRVRPAAGGKGGSLVTEEVFISSGLPLVSVSSEEIAAGLRKDARRMRAWMEERLTPPGP